MHKIVRTNTAQHKYMFSGVTARQKSKLQEQQ